jgi:tyrosyl-tRNA synthetase
MFEGVPKASISKTELEGGVNIVEFLSTKCGILSSKGEAKRLIQNGGVSLNKVKIPDLEYKVQSDSLLNGKYILVQKGKKNYVLVTIK